jgi:hypothetical protein
MEFTVEFYETISGRFPVREKPPLSKPIGDDLFELRHVGQLNTRVFFFFVKGRRIITVHGVRHKAKQINLRDRKVAL